MIYAKNYETAAKFVKVMPKIPWPFFPGHGVDELVISGHRTFLFRLHIFVGLYTLNVHVF